MIIIIIMIQNQLARTVLHGGILEDRRVSDRCHADVGRALNPIHTVEMWIYCFMLLFLCSFMFLISANEHFHSFIHVTFCMYYSRR